MGSQASHYLSTKRHFAATTAASIRRLPHHSSVLDHLQRCLFFFQVGIILLQCNVAAFSTIRIARQSQRMIRIRHQVEAIQSGLASTDLATQSFDGERSRWNLQTDPLQTDPPQQQQQTLCGTSPLSIEFGELSKELDGRGRAKIVWDCLRRGVDPLEDELQTSIGRAAKGLYESRFGGRIRDRVSQLSNVQVSQDGTAKLLLRLHRDGLEVETVIIPWEERQTSTLCISSQVGCRQACTFCMTGRMGKLRSLTADEILSQMFHAVAASNQLEGVYPIDNVVFMGMGEPADNSKAVLAAAKVLANANQFQLAPRRITISTVAPNPQSFLELGQASAVLAWSVHASRDEIRKQLVPTTQHSMVELREGLIQALQKRSRRLQSIMLEVTLLDGINDSVQDALHLAEFCRPIAERVPNMKKLVINLIPWNDIAASSGPAKLYQTPSKERVLVFQQTLMDCGVRCCVRTTRGDDESAACGQLATSKKQEIQARTK